LQGTIEATKQACLLTKDGAVKLPEDEPFIGQRFYKHLMKVSVVGDFTIV
jgi:hypothetical protein